MKNTTISVIVLSLYSFVVFAQSKPYWNNAPNTGTKIYSIHFIDSQNVWAKSKLGEVLQSTDGGNRWFVNSPFIQSKENEQNLWCADIYCSIMLTTDGGTSWLPYRDTEQEHFCKVYFKNENTGWQTAEEFLNKVVVTINSSIEKNDIETLIERAHQCTEYYTDIDSGWALGWCVKNFEIN